MKTRSQNLIEILLDKEATICERDDAAMDLEESNDDDVLAALMKSITLGFKATTPLSKL